MSDVLDDSSASSPSVPVPGTRTRVHHIQYLAWQREGQQTLAYHQARLLDTLAALLEAMPADAPTAPPRLLASYAALLDDVAAVHPALLRDLREAATWQVGAWYVPIDGMLTGGEALVRNLLVGRDVAQQHKFSTADVLFNEGVCQYTGQIPQILQGFGMDAALLCVGKPIMSLPFLWDAPDDSTLLVVSYENAPFVPYAIARQRRGQPDGPFLWITPFLIEDTNADETADTDSISDKLAIELSGLREYVEALRDKLPDALRPRLRGEVHLQKYAQVAGRFSARIPLKQAIASAEAQLLHHAEPLSALALTHGTLRFPRNQRALLAQSWRTLLQNLAQPVLTGAISDAVADEAQLRNRRIAETSQQLMTSALQALPGTLTSPEATAHDATTDAATNANLTEETYITVWNPHGHAVTQVVELSLHLREGWYPAVLHAPDDDECAFHWEPDTHTLGFRAEVPAVGYAVYTLQLSQSPTAAYNQKRVVAARMIGSVSGESLGITNGRLEWATHNTRVQDVLSYHDGGDAGDVWQYRTPQPDMLMRGSLVGATQVEATPTYERLHIQHRMRIAPHLSEDGARKRGLRVLDMSTTATYYHDVPGIYIRTQFTNTADDHRLRAHLRTSIAAEKLYADGAFALLSRAISAEATGSTQPIRSVAALHDDKRGVALFTRGLYEIEPLHQDDQVTLALTLLRSVGWLNKEAGSAAAGAQERTSVTAEYMLCGIEADLRPAALLRQSSAYRAPLRAMQYDIPPRTRQQSYLTLDDDRVVLTALKPTADNNGWIVRLLNPTRGDIGIHLHAQGNLQRATQLSLAEDEPSSLTVTGERVNLTLPPQRVVTVRLDFD